MISRIWKKERLLIIKKRGFRNSHILRMFDRTRDLLDVFQSR